MLTKEQIEALLENDDASRIAVDDDGDAYLLPSGLPNNLLALPACDDNGKVLNVLQWQNMVARYNLAPDLARTALDALARLSDAQAAQALVVERAVGVVLDQVRDEPLEVYAEAIRALADPSGVEALAALRAERDAALAANRGLVRLNERTEADRDHLAAANAALEAQVAELRGMQGAARVLLGHAETYHGEFADAVNKACAGRVKFYKFLGVLRYLAERAALATQGTGKEGAE